jgi:hypothetical protein
VSPPIHPIPVSVDQHWSWSVWAMMMMLVVVVVVEPEWMYYWIEYDFHFVMIGSCPSWENDDDNAVVVDTVDDPY